MRFNHQITLPEKLLPWSKLNERFAAPTQENLQGLTSIKKVFLLFKLMIFSSRSLTG